MGEKHEFEGLIFVACMFIGGGIGLAFGRPDVGGAVGMGVGFLLMGLVRTKKIKPTPVALSLPRSFGQIAMIVVGLLLIFCGVCLLYEPGLLYPYVASMAAVILGIIFLLAGLIRWGKKADRYDLRQLHHKRYTD